MRSVGTIMRHTITMLLALTLSAGSIVSAAPRRRAVAPVPDELTITFVSRAGLLDLGKVSHTGQYAERGRTVRSETITMPIVTSEKFCFTTGTLPKRIPAPRHRPTHPIAPMKL